MCCKTAAVWVFDCHLWATWLKCVLFHMSQDIITKGSNHTCTCKWCSNHVSGDLMQCSFVITVHLDEFQKCLPQERLLDDKASDAVTRQQTVDYSGSQKRDKLVYCLTVRIWQSNHKRPYTEHLILIYSSHWPVELPMTEATVQQAGQQVCFF